MTEDLALAAEFPPIDGAEWRRLVDKALKGASFEKRLVGETYDGLRIEPLYPRAQGVTPVTGRGAVPWQILQRIDHPDPAAANAEALHDLENGATGLVLVLAGAPAAHGYGLAAETVPDLERALAGVRLNLIPLRVETAPFAGRPVATRLTALLDARKSDLSALAIDFGLDPIGDTVRSGGAPWPWPQLSARAGATAADLKAKGFAKARFMRIDGRAVHAAGGSEAQELAFAIATGVDYLRLLEAAGFAPEEARERLTFLLAADAEQFLTIAKFRALRRLWARIEAASGLAPRPAFVAAETAWRMMTARDPYVNILRATIAVAAAGIGGADAIGVLPFTAAIGLPDRFARRVARNLQLVLLEESNLYRVADPAAGAGGIEALTEQMARAAWSLFQEIESHGGAAAAIDKGLLQRRVAATRAARQAAVARRKDAITGVSDYPDLAERPVATLAVPRIPAPVAPAAARCDALPPIRLAEPYEALRDAADRRLAATGARPKVFLANLGRLSDFTARATFAKNFYEAGGIEAIGNDGFLPSPREAVGRGKEAVPPRTNLEALLAAFKASGARLACLCSSDPVYESEAAEAASALHSAGAIVHLAGRPGEREAEWYQAGVQTFIYTGCDVLSILRAAHDRLGVG